ncbi:DNA-binding transcriptional regulator, GntR family [Sinosporangium album]|uniref:DNA-binding transcriptional regulator, GntR family n=1 Tax=Sinosporangium album TaxID=504805 RepID=A0A1G7QS02_9ACTN|nr:FCD domain-containing protein [Sinosporangium album]SDG00649.1 DNA-binding transcriptional regulator, GntR family [Sinosporangium album]
MPPEKARASTEVVHALIRADLLAGVHQPGEKLKFSPLCERYGASVSVIREALTHLAGEGLVIAEPRIGFRVRDVSLQDLKDLTATRIDIESLALRYAIERGDVEWESRVVAAHHRLERTPMVSADDPARIAEDWESAHGCFHATLLDGCGSPRLLDIARGLRDAAEFYRRWSQTRDPDRDVAGEHKGILEATLARDTDAAEARLRAHYARTVEILEPALRDKR